MWSAVLGGIAPVLAKPLLMGTDWQCCVDSADQLQSLLNGRFHVHELDAVAPSLHTKPEIRLEVASANVGKVDVVSVAGVALQIAVDPCQPTCMVALPTSGWGQFQMDEFAVDNVVGRSVAYIPARGWRLVNDVTGGTSLQFQLESMLAVMHSINPALRSVDSAASLATPFVVDMGEQRPRAYYKHLLTALYLVEQCFLDGSAPDPRLCLDDLILRCLALLLFPSLSSSDDCDQSSVTRRDLRRTVRELMGWMEAHVDHPVSLTELEQRAGYGRRALQLGFKAEVGCGPMQWLRQQRLEQAHVKLLHPTPGLTVGDVARSCGYLSLTSFSRDFTARFGMPASRFLRHAKMRSARQGEDS